MPPALASPSEDTRRAGTAHAVPAAAAVRRIDSREILGAAPEIEIVHRSQVYRLRLTALGKLILTK